MKTLSLLFLLAAALVSDAAAQTKKPVAPVSQNEAGLALRGYDPVAYFKTGHPAKGDAAISFEHEGATYRFASAAHRDEFAKEPARYTPQYGGYCAWAVGNNYTAPADPEAWKIVNGKLYLNYNKDVQQKWLADEKKLIEAGDRNWPALHR